MAELDVYELVKEYPTPSKPLRVLDSVSFSLDAGESLAVVGPSGSGKSTLLSILGTLEVPTSGSIRLAEQDPFLLGQNELAAWRRTQIGFIFQEHHLLPQCTVWENVLVPFLGDGSASVQDEERAAALIERVGLNERRNHRPSELSGGERQRVAIARALVRKPRLLLADEPTGNLDRTTAATIAELLAGLPKEQSAILVLVTHSASLSEIADRKTELDNGQLKLV